MWLWRKEMIKITKILVLISILFSANLKAQTWSNGPGMNYTRAGASAVTWNGKIYVFGGKSLNNKVLNNVEVFDPSTAIWDSSSIPPFTHARYNASICVWNDTFYLTGGRTIESPIASMEIYNPVSNTWKEAHDLRTAREGHTANYFNDRVYVIGGQNGSNYLIDDVEWYDEEENEWNNAALFKLPYPRSAHFSTYDDNDNYYMFGGLYWTLTNTIYKATKSDTGYSWAFVDTLSQARAYGISERIGNLVYLIGGETDRKSVV